ncbi:uncharacterized protein LOC134755217 [Cydia strobilella]|uniref:uncharacterized protein LOC134755217 n=1 Tax=Cydia strobilella TaxID=1100964 RepID=UPI003007AD7D
MLIHKISVPTRRIAHAQTDRFTASPGSVAPLLPWQASVRKKELKVKIRIDFDSVVPVSIQTERHLKGMSFVSQTVAGLSKPRREEPPAPPRQYCPQAKLQLSRKNSLPEWDPPTRARKNSLPTNILDTVAEDQ